MDKVSGAVGQTDDAWTDDDWDAVESEAADTGESGGVDNGAGAVPDTKGGTPVAEDNSQVVPGAGEPGGGDQYYSDDELAGLTVEQVDLERVPKAFRKHWEQVKQKHAGADAKFRESASLRKEMEELRKQQEAWQEQMQERLQRKREEEEEAELDPDERWRREVQREVQSLKQERLQEQRRQEEQQLKSFYREIDLAFNGLGVGAGEDAEALRELHRTLVIKGCKDGSDGFELAASRLKGLMARRNMTEGDAVAFFEKNPQAKAKFLKSIIAARKSRKEASPIPDAPAPPAKAAPVSVDDPKFWDQMFD